MGWSHCLGASWWDPHAGLVETCPLPMYHSNSSNTERMKSHAVVDTDGRLCSQQFSRSHKKNESSSPKLGAGLEQVNLKQGGCSSPGMNLTSHTGTWSSSMSSHTEMSKDNL